MDGRTYTVPPSLRSVETVVTPCCDPKGVSNPGYNDKNIPP